MQYVTIDEKELRDVEAARNVEGMFTLEFNSECTVH